MAHRGRHILIGRSLDARKRLFRSRVGTRTFDELAPFARFGIRFSFDVVGAARCDDAEGVEVLLHPDRRGHVDLLDRDEAQETIFLTREQGRTRVSLKIRPGGHTKTHLVALVHGEVAASEHEPSLLPRLASLAFLHEVSALERDVVAQSAAVPAPPRWRVVVPNEGRS